MKTISGFQETLVWIQCNSTLWPMAKCIQLRRLNDIIQPRYIFYIISKWQIVNYLLHPSAVWKVSYFIKHVQNNLPYCSMSMSIVAYRTHQSWFNHFWHECNKFIKYKFSKGLVWNWKYIMQLMFTPKLLTFMTPV